MSPRRRLGASLCLILCLMGGGSSNGAAEAGTAPETSVALRLMETTDLHVYLADYDYLRDQPTVAYGLARTATLIAQSRAEVRNSLLLDDGDLIQGSPLGDFIAAADHLKPGQIHPVYKAMNALHYDAAALGNHEFNYGLDFLRRALKGAAFPTVCANVVNLSDGKPLVAPDVILKRRLLDGEGKPHEIRIAILGLVTPQITIWDRANLQGKVTALDMVETARRKVPELRARGADLVIILAHSGLSRRPPQPMDENAVAGLSLIPGVDAILFGHSHVLFPGPTFANSSTGETPSIDLEQGTINGIPATEAGAWGNALGIVDLTLEVDRHGKWRVAEGRGSVRPIARSEGGHPVALVEDDPALLARIQSDHTAALASLTQPIGTSAIALDSYFALARPDPISGLIARAQAWYIRAKLAGTAEGELPLLSAASPFKAGGRMGPDYFADIPAGPLTARTLAEIYPYPNTIYAVVVTGAQLREWLEMAANVFNTIKPSADGPQSDSPRYLVNEAVPAYVFDALYGLSYSIDLGQPNRYDGEGKLARPASHRIVDLRYQGQEIDPAQRFVVAVNNYRANGGGHVPGLDGSNIVFSGPDEARAILADYIRAGEEDKRPEDPAWSAPWRFAPRPAKEEGPVILLRSSAAARDRLPLTGPQEEPTLSFQDILPDGFATYRLMLPRP